MVFAAEAQPIIYQQPTNQTVFVGGSTTFNVAVRGVGPFTYQWRLNGTNLGANLETITTVAGNGNFGYSGDGGRATKAELFEPIGVAVDVSSNIFIADLGNRRIRRVATTGTITTVAGNGTNGYSGDGGLGTNAKLNTPSGVAVDGNGNVFIADTGNQRIRELFADGGIGTFAGNGINGNVGTGINNTILSIELSNPQGVAVDSGGNVFIADTGNNRILKISTNSIYWNGKGNRIITTVAGNAISGYSGDGGAATKAELNGPEGIAVDGSGNVFFADIGNQRIRKVATTGIITTVAGNGTNGYSGDGGAATNAKLSAPTGVVVDGSGNVLIADMGNQRIRKVATTGIITTVAGNGTSHYSGDGGAATEADLSAPYGVAIDSGGNLLIADFNNSRIREVINSSETPLLYLNYISTNNAGNYSVIIIGFSGSITSNIARLTVALPVYNQISCQLLGSGKMQFSFSGIAGVKYALYRSFSLSPATWISQVTNTADAFGNLAFTNLPNATTNNFWRIGSVP